jgi:dual specificity MAP kinase phosphatase
MLLTEEKGGSKESQDAKVWFEDKRFDGFPSRIMDFLYLGNL